VFAVTVEWQYQGVVSNAGFISPETKGTFSLPFNASVGDSVSGVVIINYADLGTDNTLTHKYYFDQTESMSLTINGYDIYQPGNVDTGRTIQLYNDDVSLGGVDQIHFQRTDADPSDIPGYQINTGLILKDTTASVFTSLELPTTLSLNDFNINVIGLGISSKSNPNTGPYYSLSANIVSLEKAAPVPIPPTIGLFGVGILGLFWAGKLRIAKAS